MDELAIKNLIDKYHLVKRGNQIGTYHTQGIDVAQFQAEVGPHKQEILDYFEAQERAERERIAQRELTFEHIPGVAEIRAARQEWAEYRRAFNQIMDTGESIFPPAPSVNLKALEQKYPDAVFALQVEREVNSENHEIYCIAKRAYELLCDGESIETVQAKYMNEIKQFVKQHQYD